MHSQVVPAMSGKMASILSPSRETELTRPGLLQNCSDWAQISALGLSTAMGVSVTLCTRSMSHFMVSSSMATSVEAQTSMKWAPASAWVLASSLMKSSSFLAMASAT